MSATMARQGGCVQLELSNMHWAFNMARIAEGGWLCAAMEETQYLIMKDGAEVLDGKKRGVQLPGQTMVKVAIERLPAMLRPNHSTVCLPFPNGNSKHLQKLFRREGTGAPPPNRCRESTPEPPPEPSSKLKPPQPRTPSAPTGNTSGTQRSHIINLLAPYVYSYTSLLCAELFFLDAAAQDSQNNTDVNPDMRTDEETATGLYTLCCVVIQLTFN